MEPSDISDYEKRRLKNKAENAKFLREVFPEHGTSQPVSDIKIKRLRKKTVEAPVKEFVRSVVTRSSSRLASQDGTDAAVAGPTMSEVIKPPSYKRDNVFGPIDGVAVGTNFSTRLACCYAGVHRPTVAGIHGNEDEGCYSLVFSGGYEGDIDEGDMFIYSGAGGRDLKGTKSNPKNLRTAPQSKDQVMTGTNLALALNVKSGDPVRVVRGYKLQSVYAPEEGYRYDGLYKVEEYWAATGKTGFLVFKYRLRRIEDQEPAPWHSQPQN